MEFYNSCWKGITKWQDKLDRKAKIQHDRFLKDEEAKEQEMSEFAHKFKKLTSREKAQWIGKKSNRKVPRELGRYKAHWQLQEKVWKMLVWYYKVERKKGRKVHLPNVARSEWFECLVEWPNDPISIEKLSKDLWFWFKELEKKTIAFHEGRQWILIDKNLGKSTCSGLQT